MRKRYSFSSRRTGHTEKMRKQRQKYPALLVKVLDESDIIIEVLDARFIKETRNLEFEKEIKEQKKKLIYVINKLDLVKGKKVQLANSVIVSCKNRKGIRRLRDKIKELSQKIEKSGDEKIIVGVVGYPNTGKSSLINLLIGRKSAKTGSDAGFTKGLQKLKLSQDIILLDSPGVIPKEEYSDVKKDKLTKHAMVGGRSYSQVKDPEMVVAGLMKEFPGVFQKYYNIKTKSSEYLIERLGRQKNFLKKGNQVDVDKTARFILKDWQAGKIKVG